MLSNEQNFVLFLLRHCFGLTSESRDVPADEKKVAEYIVKSSILPTIYSVLPDSLQTILAQKYYAAVKQSICQEYEGDLVLDALCNAGFDCIALKGWELRKLYPESTMRQMADLDFLVRPYQYDRIKTVMRQLGFNNNAESSWKHDNFQKGEILVEMHKRLTDDSKGIQVWEREMWERATPQYRRVFEMAPEDYYIFHFVHLHKDFMNGSLGLRRIVDTWLLSRQAVDLDFVKAALEKFGMWTFHERMIHLAKAAMGEAEMDDGTELLLNHAFTYGIYGTDRSYKAGRIVAMGGNVKTGKLRSAVAAVFLPYSRMKAQFPILEKYPILLPVCWSKRTVSLLHRGFKRNAAQLNYSHITAEDYEHMKRFFEAGGVR